MTCILLNGTAHVWSYLSESINEYVCREEWLHILHLVASCDWPDFEKGISKKDQEYLTNLMKRILKQAEETIQENSK